MYYVDTLDFDLTSVFKEFTINITYVAQLLWST